MKSKITLKASRVIMPDKWSAKRDTVLRLCCGVCYYPEHRCPYRQEKERRPRKCTFLTHRRNLRK